MQIVGFMEDEVQLVLELVAAVLKLGNIEFKPESRCNGTDESRVKDKNGGLDAATPSSDIFYTVIVVLFFLFRGVIVNIFSFHLTLLTHCSLGLVQSHRPLLAACGPQRIFVCYDLRDKSFTLTAALFREIIHLHFSLSESWTTMLSSFFPHLNQRLHC